MNAQMPDELRTSLVERFFRGTGVSYDAMVSGATFGIDRRWKRRLVSMIPPDAMRVLDLACGTGISTLAIARRFPRCTLVGVELRDEYLHIARAKLARYPELQIELVLGRAEDYRSDVPFDCITSSYLAKYADIPVLCRNAYAMLRPNGVFLAHDFTYPPKPYLVRLFNLYFRGWQLVGTRLFPSWREIYYGLPALIERTTWVADMQNALASAGFTDIRREDLTLYGAAIISARKPLPSGSSAHR
jgi:demethylmenaquinone methyltransferase / 2-methoxy-6-polyprenyl-1,4-benzoquinol methylase